LPSVRIKGYNVEIEDEEGFVGDRANKSAFWELLERWREPLKELGEDPLDGQEIGKKKLASLLAEGSPAEAALVHSAVEDFAQQLASVIRRFLRLKDWRDTECLVIGGGFTAGRIGQLAVARCQLILKADDIDVVLNVISNDPDHAGLIGAAHLLPPWMLKGHDGILAVDVGGTNIRCGIVDLNLNKAKSLSKARVMHSEVWRHSDEHVKRDDAVEELARMLKEAIARAEKRKFALAPVIAVGCPGIIEEDGSIERGAQNLPGNWESGRFNLPRSLREEVPSIGEHETMVVMHNDAVVQGLSELPNVKDLEHWGVLTIGTGLGNASFVNRTKE
jgi:hypothetical protein